MSIRHWYHVLFYSLIPALVLLMQIGTSDNSSDAKNMFIVLIVLYIPIAAIVAFILMAKHKRDPRVQLR